MMDVNEYFEIYTGGNDYIKTWTPKALKDFAEDYHKMKVREPRQANECGLLHSPDWNGKCFHCGEQVFVRKEKSQDLHPGPTTKN